MEMSDQRVFRILCIGDSRLNYLQTWLNNNLRAMRFSCYVFAGATLGYLAYQLRLILSQCGNNYYKLVVVVAGICDLTVLDKTHSSRVARPAYPTVELMVVNFERLFSLFRLTVSLYTQTPVIFSTIAGIHLNRYANSDCPALFHLQPVLDSSIPLINIMVKRVNEWNNLPTIDLARSIHHAKGRNGKYRTRYCRMTDGYHPNNDTRKEWVQEILMKLTNFIYSQSDLT